MGTAIPRLSPQPAPLGSFPSRGRNERSAGPSRHGLATADSGPACSDKEKNKDDQNFLLKSFCVASATGWSENREFSKPVSYEPTEAVPHRARLGVSRVKGASRCL